MGSFHRFHKLFISHQIFLFKSSCFNTLQIPLLILCSLQYSFTLALQTSRKSRNLFVQNARNIALNPKLIMVLVEKNNRKKRASIPLFVIQRCRYSDCVDFNPALKYIIYFLVRLPLSREKH